MGGLEINTSVLVLSQLLALACLGFVATLLYLRRITSRKEDLTARLGQLAALNKSTVALLGKVLTQPKPEAPTNAVSPNALLTQWLADTEAYLSLHKSDPSPPIASDPLPLQSAKLRYHILLTEQQLYQKSDAPINERATLKFWQDHTAAIKPIIENLMPPDKPVEALEPDVLVMEKDDENLHEQLTALRGIIQNQSTEILNLKAKIKNSEIYKESVLDCWGGKHLEFEQTFERLQRAIRVAPNTQELNRLINQLFSSAADVGEAISNERMKQKPNNLMDDPSDTSPSSRNSRNANDRRIQDNGQVIQRESLAMNSANKNMRKALDQDVTQMKTVILKQKQVINELRGRITELESSTNPRLVQEYEQQCIQFEQLLNENDQCIQTLETELGTAQSKVETLEEELLTALEVLADYQAGDSESIRKLTQEQLSMLEQERNRLKSQAKNAP